MMTLKDVKTKQDFLRGLAILLAGALTHGLSNS